MTNKRAVYLLEYMKISLSWLKRYIDISVDTQALGDVFVQLGFEIESEECVGYCGQGPLVVGRVLEKIHHPQSDHLSICQVEVGQEKPLQIVCGASNFKVNDFVPVALEGARLNGVELKKTQMRGVESCGMMCSASELGLEKESSGLYILNDLNPKIGTNLQDLFANTTDTIFDLSITSNRGDCLSYIGIARELSAYFNLPLKPFASLENLPASNGEVSVHVSSDACDFYSGCVVRNVHVGSSPEWLVHALSSAGLRSVNNVVDLTNFILLEQGQPLHAFDLDQIHGNDLYIRQANSNEALKTLDGVDRVLSENQLVIADDEQCLAIAGIMGGKDSEITDRTQNIFIECAHFSVDSIRKSTHELNLSSDSSYRFERHVCKAQASCALKRILWLLKELDPQVQIADYVSVGSDVLPQRFIDCSLDKVERLLGFHVEQSAFVDTLQRLGFKAATLEPRVIRFEVPSYRFDVQGVEDCIEEFLRFSKLNELESRAPEGKACYIPTDACHTLRMRHAQFLSAHGFFECYTDSLQDKSVYAGVVESHDLEPLLLPNPLSQEHACLRTSLLPGLLEVLKNNRNYGNHQFERLFESGRIFKVHKNGSVEELFATAFIVCPSKVKTWDSRQDTTYYDIQSWVRSLLTSIGMSENVVQTADKNVSSFWQKDYSGHIGNWEQRGFEAHLGCINIQFSKHWFKDSLVWGAECVWMPERLRIKDKKIYTPFNDWPTIRKDLSLILPQNVLAETVRQNIEKSCRKWIKNPIQLRDVSIFDYFVDASKQASIAVSITFGSNVGNLTDENVQKVFEQIIEHLEKQFSYSIRKKVL